MRTSVTIQLALVCAGLLATAQAQTGPTLVPKWTNTTVFAGVFQANADGGAYNPATGNLLVSSTFPNLIVVCRPSDGASNAVLSLTGVAGGTYAVCGLNIGTNGVIYACNCAVAGGTKLYSWANESATPVNFANSTNGAGNVGQTMAMAGAGTNAVFILSSSTTGAVYVYYDGANWQSKQLTVSSGTVMGGFSIVSWSPSSCVFITKNISGAGNYNTFNPGMSSPITVVQTAFSSMPLGSIGAGTNKVSIQGAGGYDPVTGLFGFHTFTLTASPYTISNYLVLTTGNTLAAPNGCAPITSAVGVNTTGSDSGAHYGADFWGKGVFYTMPASTPSKGFGFRAYDVTAFKVSDISPASITTNTGASVAFAVVSGGSGLSYQWQVNTGSGYVNVSGSRFSGTNSNTLTISSAGTNDTGSYLCTVTGVSGSSWTSSAGALTVVPPPAVPTGLSATGGYEQISLSWNASANATSYNVYRGSSGNTVTNFIGSSTTTNFTDSGLSDATTWFYAVTGVNISGESAASGTVSAQTVPAAPTTPVATAGFGQVNLSWTAPAGATSYNIYRSTSSGTEIVMTNVTATSFTDMTVADASYYYVITAVGAGGQGATSSEVSGMPNFPTTIDAVNRYSYGANFGWMDWLGDTIHGAVVGTNVCSGYVYSANVGWIKLGSGFPANRIRYQNNSASDFGVNVDGSGNLSGYAYGANIGWVTFTNIGAPKVDLASGNLSGYVWSANCGWISLSNAVAYVQTDTIYSSDANGDGIPDLWELQNFGTINIDPNADPNGNGVSNMQEYLAGTNPLQPGNYLRNVPSTIVSGNHYAYGANFGWMDWLGDTIHGAVVGTNVCSGYVYSANVGWIKLGSGFPANRIRYQNNSASDFGVNVDGSGNLSGYAYGANIGWVTFTNIGAPKVDLASGNLSGYVWSANCGWISLSNTVAYVQAAALQQSAPPVTALKLGGTAFTGGGCGFGFTNVPGASSSFTVWTTTNLTQPFSNWTSLGNPKEVSSGSYQFTDPQAITNAQRFYRVTSP